MTTPAVSCPPARRGDRPVLLSDPRGHSTIQISPSERDLVVEDPLVASGLVNAGIRATTFSNVLAASDINTMVRFAGEPVVLVPTRESMSKAAAVANRLDRLGLAFSAIRELLDRRLP
jgi:hypothetical protein